MSITKFTTSVDTLHLHHSNKGIVHVIIGTFNVCSFLELGIILNFGWLETISDRKVVAFSIALSFFHLVINATDFVLVNYNWIKMLHASKNNKWNRKKHSKISLILTRCIWPLFQCWQRKFDVRIKHSYLIGICEDRKWKWNIISQSQDGRTLISSWRVLLHFSLVEKKFCWIQI